MTGQDHLLGSQQEPEAVPVLDQCAALLAEITEQNPAPKAVFLNLWLTCYKIAFYLAKMQMPAPPWFIELE